MTRTNVNILLAIAVTALLMSVILIASFAGFLFFWTQAGPAPITTEPAERPGSQPLSVSPRKRGPIVVEADEITEIHLLRSSMRSTASTRPSAFFGNINVQNFFSESTTLTFFASGIAQKIEASERTVDGNKVYSGPSKYEVDIGRDPFAQLATLMAENDFANEPDSTNITSLPERVELTVTFGGTKKVIKASNTGQDTPELAAMLQAVDKLAERTDWQSGQK